MRLHSRLPCLIVRPAIRCLSSGSAQVVNIPRFIRGNRHRLQPPVGNAMLFDGRVLKVMLVGGPNARSDYHIEKGEELFVQLKGNVHIDIVEDRRPQRLCLHEDNLLILPPGVPHSPQRYDKTVGLVVERTRRSDERDCLRWYAPLPARKSSSSSGKGAELEVSYEETFHCRDLGTQIKEVIERYSSREPAAAASAPRSSSSPLDEYFAVNTPSHRFVHFNHTIAGGAAPGPSPQVIEIARSEEFRVHTIRSPRCMPADSELLWSAWVPIASGEALVWLVEGEALVEFAATGAGGEASEAVELSRGDALLRGAGRCRLRMRGAGRAVIVENIAMI